MTSTEGCDLVFGALESRRSQVDLTALVEAHAALLFRVAYSMLRHRAEAEDVVQDVFVRVLEHRGSLGEIREMRVWLIRIAWNLALDRRRRIRPEQYDARFVESLVGSNVPADVALDEAQRMMLVMQELQRLPKGERHVLVLSAIEELGTREIAQVLGRSESAVRALIYRARTRLRERLERERRKR